LEKEISSEEIFYYIYAILYAPTYRERYSEFLKIDFPKIPITNNYKLFKKFSDLGKTLVELHILKSPMIQKLQATYPMKGNDIIERIEYDEKKRRVHINDIQYFGGIPQEIWKFRIGIYQVLDKWLKARKGRKLSWEEIETYCKVVSSIKHTIKTMEKINELYDKVEKNLIEYEKLNQNQKLSDFGN
jgi:predicted helicase